MAQDHRMTLVITEEVSDASKMPTSATDDTVEAPVQLVKLWTSSGEGQKPAMGCKSGWSLDKLEDWSLFSPHLHLVLLGVLGISEFG